MQINIQLPKKLEPVFTKPGVFYRCAYGGRGSAKTLSFAQVAIARALSSKIRVMCCREILISIKESVHAELCQAVEMMGLSDYFDCGRNYIRCIPTGSEFFYRGLYRNLDNLKGVGQVDICWIDEADSVSELSYVKLLPSIRKLGAETWITWNPERLDSPTRTRFILNPPPDNDIAIAEINWRDNPWFPQTLERQRVTEMSRDYDRYLHVWEGQCTTRSDAQIFAGKWKVQEFEPQDNDDWQGPYFGADWGFAVDPSVLVKCWVHNSCLYVEHEAYGIRTEIKDLPDLFDQIPESRGHRIEADSARPETISYMKGEGFKIYGVEKWKGSVEDGIEHLRGAYDKIIFHPRCKHSIQEAGLYSYKVDLATDQVTGKIVDAHNHCWDAIRYAVGKRIKRNHREPMMRFA